MKGYVVAIGLIEYIDFELLIVGLTVILVDLDIILGVAVIDGVNVGFVNVYVYVIRDDSV